MKKWMLLFILLLSVSTVLGACGGDKEGEMGVDGNGVNQEITLNIKTEPPSLDPGLSTDTTSAWVLDHVFEGLYTTDEDGNPILGAAESVDVTEGGAVHTFTIRDDANWTDGTPVTAADFEYAWKRVLNPEVGSRFAFYLYYIKGAEEYNTGNGTVEEVGVEAVDEKTLKVTLNAPLGYFDKLLTMWTYYPVKKELVEGNKDWSTDPETYISNGPFKMTKWAHDSEIVIEKNKDYYDESTVKLNKVTFKMVNEATTFYQMYKTGELDLISTLPTDVLEAERDSDEYLVVPRYGTYMYIFNVTKEPFTNAKVRKAFSLSVNRDLVVDNINKAGEIPAYGMVPPGVATPDGDFREVGGNHFEEDADEAKKLLAEGMKEEGWDTLPQVELLYTTSEGNKKIAEAVQEMIKKNLDIDLKLVNQESKTQLATVNQGNFQMSRMGWVGTFVDPVINLDYFLGGSPNNRTGWVNDEYDSLLEQSKIEQDDKKRYDLLHQAEAVLMEDMPFIPMYYNSNTYLTSPKLENVAYYVNRQPFLKWAEKVK
ncbi:MAG: peptide ABC transporter substrate-binding protein [Solibacillus sp.]